VPVPVPVVEVLGLFALSVGLMLLLPPELHAPNAKNKELAKMSLFILYVLCLELYDSIV
jgi:hypothetical protein